MTSNTRFLVVISFVAISLLALSANGLADSIVLHPTEDVLVNSTKAVVPGYYASFYLSVYYDGTVYNRSFLKFDLGSIPDSATITKAELWLYDYDNAGFLNPLVDLRHVSDDSWSEATTLWGNMPAFDSQSLGQGSPAPNSWITFDLLQSNTWNYSLDLTDNSLSLLLKEGETSTDVKKAQFYASDYDGGHPALQPYLALTYVPEPSTLALLGTGIIGLAVAAWRGKK